ncbi:hypothetical protein HNR59_001253 [Aquamicrobium lusatiense]|uniref:Uncharacterized protein n=1 Tax=Aquamicrobium lusatiense TaxID=89772 RepID=A0A7W9S2V2_9HYPH|nr:hypothetical protein [Aquamicrobium lusatiense]
MVVTEFFENRPRIPQNVVYDVAAGCDGAFLNVPIKAVPSHEDQLVQEDGLIQKIKGIEKGAGFFGGACLIGRTGAMICHHLSYL